MNSHLRLRCIQVGRGLLSYPCPRWGSEHAGSILWSSPQKCLRAKPTFWLVIVSNCLWINYESIWHYHFWIGCKAGWSWFCLWLWRFDRVGWGQCFSCGHGCARPLHRCPSPSLARPCRACQHNPEAEKTEIDLWTLLHQRSGPQFSFRKGRNFGSFVTFTGQARVVGHLR